MSTTLEQLPLGSLPFPRAAKLWFEQHCQYIKPTTMRGYAATLKQLSAFLGETTVKDIHIGHIRGYQTERLKRCGPYQINGEIMVLQMILKEARCWKETAELYKPLRAPRRIAGHSITEEEEKRLRDTAFSRPKWRLAGHCMIVMLSTTMGFGELSHVRRCDIDLERKRVTVTDGKNRYRDRVIPLNNAAFESVSWLVDRWERLGGCKEDQYVLPHRPRTYQGPWLFDEPQTAIRGAFEKIREAAGLPYFRVYDCRVQAITKLLSNPKVSDQVSKEIAGHISQEMQSRYSIQRFDTKKAALDALEEPGSTADTPENAPLAAQTQASPVIDLSSPAIQAELARLVASAVQAHIDTQSNGDHPRRARAVKKAAQLPSNVFVFPASRQGGSL